MACEVPAEPGRGAALSCRLRLRDRWDWDFLAQNARCQVSCGPRCILPFPGDRKVAVSFGLDPIPELRRVFSPRRDRSSVLQRCVPPHTRGTTWRRHQLHCPLSSTWRSIRIMGEQSVEPGHALRHVALLIRSRRSNAYTPGNQWSSAGSGVAGSPRRFSLHLSQAAEGLPCS